MRCVYLAMATVLVVILFLVGYKKCRWTQDNELRPAIISGTKLKLVAEYKPFHIYLYVDSDSTNKFPAYALFHRHEPVVLSENTGSNTLRINHFENGFSVLETESDEKGHVLRRTVYESDNLVTSSSQLEYMYIDTNGDGLFDKFVMFGSNALTMTVYDRSNLCWVPNAR